MGRIKLKKLLIYEPETISEINDINENKKYILAGYENIPEEKESENRYKNKESDERLTTENNIINNNIEENNNLNSININIQNNNKLQANNINKNTFFDECNNNINMKPKRKPLTISTNIKNKIKDNMPPQSNKLKTNKKIKIDINYNNYKPTINKVQKIDKKNINILTENNNDIKELNKKIENNDDNNNINTLSLNSLEGDNSTERKNKDDTLKNKKGYKRRISKKDSLAQNNMQLKEINIRFILTKEEYSILMKEKAKHQEVLF